MTLQTDPLPVTPVKRLIVNADDFGFTRDVNEGILEAHHHGILTAATIMATGPAFDHAVDLAHRNPSLDVGCHLVLEGAPGLPATVHELVRAVMTGNIQIYAELSRQVQRVVGAGLKPTHLDTHKHTHLLPPILDALVRVSLVFGIPWIRRPFDFPLSAKGVTWGRKIVSRGFGLARRRFHRVLERNGCRTTDHFAGFQITGSYDAHELVSLIAQLPAGTTEFMCHPGFFTDELQGARTRLKASRERELQALTSPEVRNAIKAAGVKLTCYREL